MIHELFVSLRRILDKVTAIALDHESAAMVAVVSFALLARLLYVGLFVGLDSPPTYDGITYDRQAWGIVQGLGYTLDGHPTAIRPPGYPLFLAGIYVLVGHNVMAVRLAQICLSSLLALVIYLLGHTLFDRRVGLWAALGVAGYPLFIVIAGDLYADSVALLTGSLSLLIAARMLRDQRWGWGLLLGITLAVTIMLRTTASLLLPLLTVWLFLTRHWRRALRDAGLMGIGVVLIFLPWVVRNYVVFDKFIPLASAGSLWGGANPLAPWAKGQGVPTRAWAGDEPGHVALRQQLMTETGKSLVELFGSEPPTIQGEGDFWYWEGLDEVETNQRFNQLALMWIRQHPLQWLALVPWKLLRAWSPASFGVAFSRTTDPRLNMVLTPPYLIFLLLVAYGLWPARRSWKSATLLSLLPLVVSATAILTFGATRHAMIMHPSLVLLAAVGFVSIIGRQKALTC